MIGTAIALLSTQLIEDEEKKQLNQTLLKNLMITQHTMFDLGAHLATPRTTSTSFRIEKTKFSEEADTNLETWIDHMDTYLSPLQSFILPGGHPAAANLHVARTVARRAERIVTQYSQQAEHSDIDESAFRYLNRLSDFLFVAARFANFITSSNEHKWRKEEDREKGIEADLNIDQTKI